jgi:hypothetical protein
MRALFLAIAAFLPAWGAGAFVQPIADFSIIHPLPGQEDKPAPWLATGDLADFFVWRGEGPRTFDSDTLTLVSADGKENGLEISLAGTQWERNRTLDLADLRGFHGPKLKPLAARALKVDIAGKGVLRISLHLPDGTEVWKAPLNADAGAQSLALPSTALQRVKSLRLMAEPGSSIRVRSLDLETTGDLAAPADELFLRSLTKLHRLYDPSTGLLAARSEIPFGAWIALPGTGMHALAVAAASTDGLISTEQARAEVKRTVASVLAIPTAKGFLPHFAKRSENGSIERSPKAEFSTVDTALALQPLLAACHILDLGEECEAVRTAIRRIDWSEMHDEKGFIRHGYHGDGTIIEGAYRGWGGEAALCVLLEGMTRGDAATGQINRSGKPFRGRGFIAELQSLFYPDFDRPEKDAISGVSWPTARRALMAEHSGYFPPASRAAEVGLWGLSAGEVGRPGTPYAANGCDDAGLRWLHPHYQIMAVCMLDRDKIPAMTRGFEKAGIWFPLGLPEGIDIDFTYHRPLCCSLNAGFEALAAWHGMKGRGTNNAIDRAAIEEPMVRMAMQRFYPQP